MKIDSSSLVRALGSAFEGSVMAPYDAGWDVTRQAFNLDIDQRQALVAMPQSAEDVVAAVRFAAEHGLRVAPQAGGHNPVPLGDLSGTILLKTAEMNAFDVHAPARRARTEAGVPWGPLVDVLSAEGLVALSGSARGVGVVPYSLARSPTDAASDHHGRPAPGRAGDRVTDLYVRADGDGVRGLGPALADGTLHIDVGATYSLERAAEALAHVLRGAGGASVVLEL